MQRIQILKLEEIKSDYIAFMTQFHRIIMQLGSLLTYKGYHTISRLRTICQTVYTPHWRTQQEISRISNYT